MNTKINSEYHSQKDINFGTFVLGTRSGKMNLGVGCEVELGKKGLGWGTFKKMVG